MLVSTARALRQDDGRQNGTLSFFALVIASWCMTRFSFGNRVPDVPFKLMCIMSLFLFTVMSYSHRLKLNFLDFCAAAMNLED